MPDKKEINLAKVGITALIDEATGYQKIRPKDALQKLHQKLEDDKGDICATCDGTGEFPEGHLCKDCSGKGYR